MTGSSASAFFGVALPILLGGLRVAATDGLIVIAGIFNYLYLALAIVARFLVKGRVADRVERP